MFVDTNQLYQKTLLILKKSEKDNLQRPPLILDNANLKKFEKLNHSRQNNDYAIDGPGGVGKSSILNMLLKDLPIYNKEKSFKYSFFNYNKVFQIVEPMDFCFRDRKGFYVLRSKNSFEEGYSPLYKIRFNLRTGDFPMKDRSLSSIGHLIRTGLISEESKLKILMNTRKNFAKYVHTWLEKTFKNSYRYTIWRDRCVATTLIHQLTWNSQNTKLLKSAQLKKVTLAYSNSAIDRIPKLTRIFCICPNNLETVRESLKKRSTKDDVYDNSIKVIDTLTQRWINLKNNPGINKLTHNFHSIKADLNSGVEKINFPTLGILTVLLYDYWKIQPIKNFSLKNENGNVYTTPYDEILEFIDKRKNTELKKQISYIQKLINKINIKKEEIVFPPSLRFDDFAFGICEVNNKRLVLLWVYNRSSDCWRIENRRIGVRRSDKKTYVEI